MGTTHLTSDAVAAAWIASIPGFTGDGVGNQLPADTSAWSANGYVVIPVTVGGTPHSVIPMRRPVVQVDCRAVNPGSGKPPWGKAAELAEQIRSGTYDRRTFGRLLVTGAGMPFARVDSAKFLTEPHRMYGDAADYAGVSFNLALQWVQVGEFIP